MTHQNKEVNNSPLSFPYTPKTSKNIMRISLDNCLFFYNTLKKTQKQICFFIVTTLFFSVTVSADNLKTDLKLKNKQQVEKTERSASNEQTEALRKEKKVHKWPANVSQDPGVFFVELKPSECSGLGGNIFYTRACGWPNLLCATKGGAMCIDELDSKE